MAAKKRRRKPQRAKTEDNVLEKALRLLESAEVSIRDCRSLVSTASKRVYVPAMEYLNAMRALNTLAAKPCEARWPLTLDRKTCNDSFAAGDTTTNNRCGPCYARHMKDGGAP